MVASDFRQSVSYRSALHELDDSATPAPWVAEGEFYGVVRDGQFRAIGFAPHHVLDPVLIAEYRNHVGTVLCAMDAVAHHLRRGVTDQRYGAAEAVEQILNILDHEVVDGRPLTAHLARLDKLTTQALWDPGHLAMGMDILEHVGGIERRIAAPSDPFLIAATRSAIPRALMVLSAAAMAFAGPNGPMGGDRAVAARLLALLEEFDAHRVDEGAGTATV